MMYVERRSLLKTLAVGGLAGMAMTRSGLGLANTWMGHTTPGLTQLRVLASAQVARSAFIQGVQASPLNHHLQVLPDSPDLATLLAVQQQLASGQPQRLIGLLDDACAALIIELARSAGARVQWLGQHNAANDHSAHQLLSANAAHGSALQLSHQLRACGQGFRLHEQRLHNRTPALQLAVPRRTRGDDQWAATLGYALAVLGSTDTRQAPLVASTARTLTGTYVSFSIAV